MKKISIIIPCYNEEEVIEISYERITKVMKNILNYSYELIFINDGSKDNTYKILTNIAQNDNNVKIIDFSRNFGHQAAVMAGLRNCTGDAAIIIDADMQDPPEVIPDMLKLWEDGNEIVYGKRKTREGETVFKTFTAKAFYRVLKKLSDIDIPVDTGDFRLIDRKVINSLCNLREHNKYIRGLVVWIGFKQYAYEYDRQERVAGKTKYPFKKMIKLALDGIISFSTKPLKIIGGMGIIALFLAFSIAIYAILSYVFSWNYLMPGWTSLMLTITTLSGIQFISIWIMSEYVARIYDEVRNRPEYIIKEKINMEVDK